MHESRNGLKIRSDSNEFTSAEPLSGSHQVQKLSSSKLCDCSNLSCHFLFLHLWSWGKGFYFYWCIKSHDWALYDTVISSALWCECLHLGQCKEKMSHAGLHDKNLAWAAQRRAVHLKCSMLAPGHQRKMMHIKPVLFRILQVWFSPAHKQNQPFRWVCTWVFGSREPNFLVILWSVKPFVMQTMYLIISYCILHHHQCSQHSFSGVPAIPVICFLFF